jgi:hypothetical protein
MYCVPVATACDEQLIIEVMHMLRRFTVDAPGTRGT